METPRHRPRPPRCFAVQVVGIGCNVPGCPCAEEIAEDPFAYTVGLWELHGFPDLLLGARPDLGDDVDGTWFLSAGDMKYFLDLLGHQLMAGEMAPGSTTVQSVDGGRGQISFHLGEPVPPHSIGALMVDPAGDAIRISWSLSLNRAARRAASRAAQKGRSR
jgi:hypothetical protein